MSHGLGMMQHLLLTTLSAGGQTVAALHRRYLKRWPDEWSGSKAKNRSRSVRHSITRALRSLEKLGKVKRGLDGLWLSTETEDNPRKETAYHEAGHAVIDLAGQLPVGMATIVPNTWSMGHVVHVAEGGESIGPIYSYKRGRLKQVTTKKEAELDPFGNPVRKRVWTPAEHAAKIIGSIAGPMAEAELRGDYTDWREYASSSDMRNARYHRGKLGDAAKSWEEYEQEAIRLIRKHWLMIEAVAARLLKVDTLSGHAIQGICRRVVRRQHLKSELKGYA